MRELFGQELWSCPILAGGAAHLRCLVCIALGGALGRVVVCSCATFALGTCSVEPLTRSPTSQAH